MTLIKKYKHYLVVAGLFTALVMLIAGVSYAAFTDSSNISGSTFSIGSADIKMLSDLSLGIDESNLVDELAGPVFSNITPNWQQDYNIKIYNNTAGSLQLTTNSNYETANDPEDLRQIIFVEIFAWNDIDNNGVLDSGELGDSFGKDTIVKWKTQGFDLGQINAGEVNSYVLRFTTNDVSDTKQGATGVFDFEFDSIGV